MLGCAKTENPHDTIVKYNIILINRSGQKLRHFHISNKQRDWEWFDGKVISQKFEKGFMLMDFDPSEYVKVTFVDEKGEKHEASFTKAIPQKTYGNTFSDGDGDVVFAITRELKVLMELNNLETDEVVKIQPDSENKSVK